MSRNIPRLRQGWASVICLAPMCCKRARTKVGACLTPGHREYVSRFAADHRCDYARWGDACGTCGKDGVVVQPPRHLPTCLVYRAGVCSCGQP